MPYKRKYNPSHKTVQLGGKVVEVEKDGKKKLKVQINAPILYDHFLKTYAKPGDLVSMGVTLRRPKRSENQNSFYHVYLGLIELSSGHSVDELKSWVNEDILGKGISEVFGHTTRIVGHSSDLNMSEFCEMMNTVMERTGVPIPDPEPFNLPLSFDEYGKLKEQQKNTYEKIKAKEFIKKKKKKSTSATSA